MSLPGSPQHNYELAVQHWLDEQNRQAEEELRERQRKEEARRKEKERQRKKQAKESLANEDTEEFIGSSARLDIALNYKITHLMLIAGGVAAVYYAYPLYRLDNDWRRLVAVRPGFYRGHYHIFTGHLGYNPCTVGFG